MFKKKKTDTNTETIEENNRIQTIEENNNSGVQENTINQVEGNNINKDKGIDANPIKKGKKKEKEAVNELGSKNKINFKTDIIEQLSNRQIITNKELKILLEDKNDVKYTTLLDFLDDIIDKFGVEKENELLDLFFADQYLNGMGYKIEKTADAFNISTTLIDLFNTNGTSSLLQKEIDDIIKSNTIPVQIINENKINKLVIISRSIEIPKNLLNIYKPIIEKKNILDMSFILVNKSTYNDIFDQLTNIEFSSSI